VRVEAISSSSGGGVEATKRLSYPNDSQPSKATDNTQMASNTLNGSIGQFGAKDLAPFQRNGSFQAAASANPVASAGLPYVQRPELTNPTASTGLEQMAIQNLLK
jgi:hypothetical protein